jgi:hypothetical protein
MIKASKTTILSIALIVGIVGVMFYVSNVKDTQKHALASLEEKRKLADEQIPQLFRQWSEITKDNGKVLSWDGKDAQILFVDHKKEQTYRRFPGETYSVPDLWTLYARSPGGRFFKLEFSLNKERNFVPDGFSLLKREDVTMLLIDRKKFELLDKLGLAYEKA